MRSISSRSLMTVNVQQMKGWRKTYKQHKMKIEEIETRHQFNTKRLKDEQQRIAQVLRRSRETAKKFKKEEEQAKRLHQDRKMVENLIDISKKPRIRSQIKRLKLKLETLPSRSVSRQKQYAEQQITQQNQRLAKSIISSSSCAKKYKKKLKSQIADYIKIRTHLQKIKPVENHEQKQKQKKKKKMERLENLISLKTEEIQSSRSQVEVNLAPLETQNEKQSLIVAR